MPFEVGQVIAGKYEIVGLIGVGGLGFVVAADHVELGEKVALKFLRPEALANAEAVARFAHEARASAQIKSEHVARVYDVGSLPDGAPFIVMEYLDGCDLSGVLQQQGPLPTQLAVDYVLQTCEALASAHASGVVHRDIKPENLFLAHRAQGMDTIKVLDFGISKVALRRSNASTRHPLVETTMAMGSPIYMSPEQLRASKDIDARTDIWSVGCVLYELLTNRLAFDAPSITHVTAVILESEPPSLRAVCPMLPPGLEAIIQRCLAKQPKDRFQDVGELAVALYPYAPPQGRFAIERVCAILRSAGLTSSKLDVGRALASDSPSGLPDGVSALPDGVTALPRGIVRAFSDRPGPLSAEASSTATVETPISRAARSLSSGRSVVIAIAAAGLAGMLMVLSLEQRPSSSSAPAPAGAEPASAQLPPPAPRLAQPETVTATPAPSPTEPSKAELSRAEPSRAESNESAPSKAEPKPGEATDEAAAARAEPENADPATSRSESESAPGTRSSAARPSASNTQASSKRRSSTPTPKAAPAPAPRPTTPNSNEPDVGF